MPHPTPLADSNLIVSVYNLTVTREGQTICDVPELCVGPGERVGIEGSNGAGKSTLLRVLGGLEHDFAGTRVVKPAQRECVFVHQMPYLFHGSVLQNLTYGLAAHSVPRRERHRMAFEWLDRLGIADLADRRIDRLSGGECRRVAIARACVLRPKLLLLDEPLADLDESGAHAVRTAIEQLPESTILIASPIPLPGGLVTRSIEMGG